MNTSIIELPARRSRRRHPAEFKRRIVQACQQGGISIAAVALANGLNANNVLGQTTFTATTAASTLAGMNTPRGLAYDSANQRLYVSQTTGNRVTTYDVAAITNGENAINVLGQSLFTGTTAANTQAGMNAPAGVFSANSTVLLKE